jgi:PIN domain nuclease of toxin-antitoxin system
MKLLLDTHAFLWWLLKDSRLPTTTLNLILDLNNELYLSGASGFEIATKVAIGKLKLPENVQTFVEKGMNQGQVQPLPIELRHTYRLATLPLHHRDPFDRLLIATALAEDMTMLTNDPEIQKYNLKIAW